MAADINIRIGASIRQLSQNLKKATQQLKQSGKVFKEVGAQMGQSISAPTEKSLKTIERELRRSSYKWKRIGSEMSESFSIAFGAIAGFSLKAGGDFEESMNGVVANTKGAEESFEELRKAAKEFGKTTSKSASESADAMEMLGRNGLNASQILNGAAEATIKLSEATKGDLSLAADISTDAMAQFGISAEQMNGTVDLIAGTLANSKFNLEGFGMALGQAGGVAGSVGVEFGDFVTSVAAIAPAFASGGDAGTGFKTFLTRLVPESAAAVDKMKELGIITKDGANQFFDASGKMRSMSEISGVLQKAFANLSEEQTNSAAKTIFGTDAMRAGIMLAKTGSSDFDKLAESIGNVSADEQAQKRMEGFNGAIKRMQSAIEGVQIAMADSGFLDSMTKLVERVTGLFVSLSETNPAIFRFALGIGAVLAAIGPLLYAVGSLRAGMAALLNISGMLMPVFKGLNEAMGMARSLAWLFSGATIKLTAAQSALNVALLANPIGMVVAAFAAFVAVLALLSTRSETARKMLNNVLGVLKNLGAFIVELGKIVFNIFRGIVRFLASALGIVVDVFQAIGNNIVTLLKRIPGVGKAVSFIVESFQWMGRQIANIINNIPAFFNGLVAEAKNTGIRIRAFFDGLALAARILGQKIQKSITIDGDSRKALADSIKKLEAQKKELASKGEDFGVAFNKAFEKAVNKTPVKVSPKIETFTKKMDVSDETGATPTKSINYNASKSAGTKGLEETTKAVEAQKTAFIDLANAQGLQSKAMTESIAPMEGMGQKLDAIKMKTEEFKTNSQIMAEHLRNFNTELTNIVNTGLSDIAAGIGEMAGQMAAGSMSMADAGRNIVGMLAGVLGQVGKLAIQTGIATAGIKVALQSLNPVAAVAGGIALVALSKFVQAKMSAVTPLAEGGILTKPVFSQGFLAGEAGPEAVIPLSKLDTMLSSARGTNQPVNVSGEFRMNGNDMVAVVKRQTRVNNRIR